MRLVFFLTITLVLKIVGVQAWAGDDVKPRLLVFDVIPNASLESLVAQRAALTNVLLSAIAQRDAFQIIDLAARDALFAQRKLAKADCDKAECRFAMARAISVAQQMLEVTIEPLGRLCIVTLKVQDVKKGTALVSETREGVPCEPEPVAAVMKDLAGGMKNGSGNGPSNVRTRESSGKNSPPSRSTYSGGAMARVPAGAFLRGSDGDAPNARPARSIVLESFEIDIAEVTVAEYEKCVAAEACPAHEGGDACIEGQGDGNARLPVNCVTWDEADRYCAWVGKRLPTEAEWEKAARGVDGRLYPWGNTEPNRERAMFGVTASPIAVASFENGRSPYGVHDMAGNVWEWVADWYDEKYYKQSSAANPKGPVYGEARVLRGGGYLNTKDNLISTFRFAARPDTRHPAFGFRCAR